MTTQQWPDAYDPYGVPTGFVPRKNWVDLPAVGPVTPCSVAIQQALDDYLLMERKARAWDEMRSRAVIAWDKNRLADMDSFLHRLAISRTPSEG